MIKNRYKLLVLTFFSVGFFSSLIENISAQEEILPLWLKTTAVWWGEDKISDQDFVNTLQYLVENKLLVIPKTEIPEPSCGPGLVLDETTDECVIHDELDTTGIFIDAINEQKKIVVSWIKVTTLWWGQDKISDQDFINALQYLVENNVITLESEIQSKTLTKLKPLPSDIIVLPKIDKIEDFNVQGHKNTDLYHIQFKLIDINKNPVNPDGTISMVIMDDKNRILYLDAFSIRKSHYEKSFEAFGESGVGKNIFAWEIKTSDIKPGFTEYGKAKLTFTDRYGNNIESQFVQISIPQFN
ncbi:MAG: hypothetical protein ACT4NJ_01720 [Nitrosopumilaceae archaeon]